MKTIDAPVRDDVFDQIMGSLAACLTPASARRIAVFRMNAETQERIAELAEKCNQGEMNARERQEYETFVNAIDMISILQAKARATVV